MPPAEKSVLAALLVAASLVGGCAEGEDWTPSVSLSALGKNLGTKLAFTSTPITTDAGDCSGVLTVEIQAEDGSPVAASADTFVSLSSDADGLTFHHDELCRDVYEFETGTEGWTAGGTVVTSVHQSNLAFRGAHSLGVVVDHTQEGGNSAELRAANGVLPPGGSRVRFQVFVSDKTGLRGLQPNISEGAPGWAYYSEWQGQADLTAGAWNELTLTVPTTFLPERFGMQFSTKDGVDPAVVHHMDGISLIGFTIPAGSSSISFRFSGPNEGNPTITAAADGLISASQQQVIGVPSQPRLVFGVQPTNVAAGAPLEPPIEVHFVNDGGDLLTGATGEVAITIGSGPGEGILSGTLIGVASGGVATFSELSIDKAGSGYSLIAFSLGADPVMSEAFEVTPAAPDHLRLVATDEPTYACEPASIELQVMDAHENPVHVAVPITLTVAAPDAPGSQPQIVAADLQDFDPSLLPASELTARTSAEGRGQVTVTLDASATLGVEWTSVELAANPQGHGASVSFVTGPVSAGLSEVSPLHAVISVNRSTRITVHPRDACGLAIGAGAAVELDSAGQAGSLSSVVDEGDGTYSAVFTAQACPATTEIGATVDGVRLDATASIAITCLSADPNLSTVSASQDEVLACATEGIGALVTVVLVDDEGEDLGPDFPVEILEDPPWIVAVGERVSELDSETGRTVHLLRVGSNRCGDEPRAVHVVAAGVTLAQAAMIAFSCPDIDPDSAVYQADPARAPADGQSSIRVVGFAADVCGNPAFAREYRLSVVSEHLDAHVSPATALSRDDVGGEDDGEASFEVRSLLAGEGGVVAEVDGVTMRGSAPDLLRFDLQEVLSLGYETKVSRAVAGQTLRLVVRLENSYSAALTDLRIIPQHEGLTTLLAEGAVLGDDGALALPLLAAGESHEIHLDVLVSRGIGTANSSLSASYTSEGVGEPNSAVSEAISIDVMTTLHQHGCECNSATGSSPLRLFFVLLAALLWLGIPRRAYRRAVNQTTPSALPRTGAAPRTSEKEKS